MFECMTEFGNLLHVAASAGKQIVKRNFWSEHHLTVKCFTYRPPVNPALV